MKHVVPLHALEFHLINPAFKVKAQPSDHATNSHDIDSPDDGVAGSEYEGGGTRPGEKMTSWCSCEDLLL